MARQEKALSLPKLVGCCACPHTSTADDEDFYPSIATLMGVVSDRLGIILAKGEEMSPEDLKIAAALAQVRTAPNMASKPHVIACCVSCAPPLERPAMSVAIMSVE